MKVTFTGVDARTDLLALPAGCEIGVLFTEKPEGRNRYPDRDRLRKILQQLHDLGFESALHVCGSGARLQVINRLADDLIRHVSRIQINGVVSTKELRRALYSYPHCTVITQYTPKNTALLSVSTPGHAILVDQSGGRGISPAVWVKPDTMKRVGYAGGLGPENIVSEVAKISAVASPEFWVDMEGKLRDDQDWFDVSRAHAVVDALSGVTTLC